MSPCHYHYALVHGTGIIPASEHKFQALAGSDSDRARKGENAMLSCLFHKVGFRLKNSFRHHTTMLNLGKNNFLISYLANPSLVSAVTDRNILKCFCAGARVQLVFLETAEDRTKISVPLSRDITRLSKLRC